MITLIQIEAAHREESRRAILAAGVRTGMAAVEVIALLEAAGRERPTFSLLTAGQQLASHLLHLAHTGENESEYRRLAADLADTLCRRYLTPEGTFLEYDHCSWLTRGEMWRTIPWGTAFRGSGMFALYQQLGDALPAESREWWREGLGKIARWICGNPVAGSFVFNCVIDLCGLLWRIGRAFDEEPWMRAALEAGLGRIRRDLDDEGFIQGENGGCSGTYQLVGARLLARFAWESRNAELLAANDRVVVALLGFSTPTLIWAGNFGTRSNTFEPLRGEPLLVSAAQGDGVAAFRVRERGEPAWSRDLALWEAALATEPAAPDTVPVRTFAGIESVKVTEGPWVAWFCNYDRSLWTRGFADLWHGALDDMVFSTLHSLPSQVEKSKLHLDDTSDWAGFPHVRVSAGDVTYDSQRSMRNLGAEQRDGIVVKWDEPLAAPDGSEGGLMRTACHFQGERLRMRIELENLAGSARADFHVMKRLDAFGGIWWGEDIDAIGRGELPRHGGWHHDRRFGAEEALGKFGFQIDRILFVFETIALPPGSALALGFLAAAGLHTGNRGGFRLRIELPPEARGGVIEIGFSARPPVTGHGSCAPPIPRPASPA